MPDNAVFEHDQISEETGRNGQNGSKIIIMEPMKKQHGATVSFHSIRYRVEQKTGPVCRRTTVQKEILLDLNGIMRPGLNAILGPTGSGKSSFLDVLAGRKDPAGLSGEVLVNGALQPANFKCLSGYVVQDDIVMGTLTVRENLSFSAALRLSSHVSPREKEARVNHLISELGLNKVADSKVGTQIIRGISGGERKRTSIGMELIIDPSVLFLDEPTTGLDASTAHSVLLLLKRMAGQGRTIIMSIHQPRFSIYRLFDSLTLLANGKQVYHGPAQDALDYFSNIGYACEAHNNPADFFLDVINGSSVTKIQNNGDAECDVSAVSRQSVEDQLMEKYRSCSFARAVRAELDHIIQTKDSSSSSVAAECHSITYSSSFCQQLRWVLWRTFWNLMLNPQTSVAQLAVTTLMAAIVGAIFYGVKDDQSGIQNRRVDHFYHEYTSGYYRVSVFFLSKILSDIITQRTIPSVLFSCVVYFMIGLKPTASAFFIFMLTVILVSCTAAAMAMAISADQSVVAVANILMTVSFIFMMASSHLVTTQNIFSGLLVNLKSIMDWLSWLKYLSIPRYGLEEHPGFQLMRCFDEYLEQALEINEFVGLSFCGNVSESLASPAAHVLM
ncbi:broad substrate specificity ATP-binding cassette transporter ABCG2d [Danio rerio]|uniref:Broad substrate specificity ATP-binding cassette transporter ABCG2 n=1 Tax=Danio rerio TaxID=7955 RepID=Q2Q444_DANRE|nr:broad substrate specificity ATP-binding cassette transporter ABCG2d [Danio rerio]ABB46493.1 ATP-binding cassette transporter sub-family G member 2d [Danio rerio]|eukprot:NP_001036237.1 ATP-binding cassette sub-family G member 2 [Danio rerio]